MSESLLIMAKAPRPGEVKTRLEPLLGADGCARLQTELIRHTAGWADATTARVSLAFAPRRARALLAPLVPGRVALFAQVTGDLGSRLRAATARLFESHAGPVVTVGTDSPLLGPEHVAAASAQLALGRDACLIPALDGGYALIALARPTPAAFAIPPHAWGGPRVLQLTLAAIRHSGLEVSVLEPIADLDTPADARQLAGDSRCPPSILSALRSPRRAEAA